MDVADFNGDGRPDVAVANRGSDTGAIHPQRPDGTFRRRRRSTDELPLPLSLAEADVDLDGDVDVAGEPADFFSSRTRSRSC